VKFDILSLFPDYFKGPFDVSILKRAREKGLIEISHTDIRAFAEGKHKKVDDRPFGGGPGMVLRPEPLTRAIRSVKTADSYVVCLSPQGNLLSPKKCQMLAQKKHLVLVCGHYEGIDERVMPEIDEEISIGDYVVTCGCAAAIVVVDAVARFIPGVIGHPDAVWDDSFQEEVGGIFGGPVYTHPEEFEGMKVPAILKGGHHLEIKKWLKIQAEEKTRRVRPELMKGEKQ
jgi:tRNA (guanine37-N1)-methyltransferase